MANATEGGKLRFKSKRLRSCEHDGAACPTLGHKRRKQNASPPLESVSGSRHRDSQPSSKWQRKGHTAPHDSARHRDACVPDSQSCESLDPATAFRESLFDALADDEGADYWESVYGQPIHAYPNTKLGPTGELERMTDEEYVSYVRREMYEKTHQHIVEERDRRARAKEKDRAWQKRTAHMEAESYAFNKRLAESLRRNDERRATRQWKDAWEKYQAGWQTLQKHTQKHKIEDAPRSGVQHSIPWPVLSGNWEDARGEYAKENVETFFRTGPRTHDANIDLSAILKVERIRWHPDKVQQRYAPVGLDGEIMSVVTAVFQVIDRLWGELKERNSSA